MLPPDRDPHFLPVTPELTDFPKGLSAELTSVRGHIEAALLNCVNLRSLRWTRDGTLSDEVLDALQQRQGTPITELEINAKSRGFYDPSLLLRFSRLTKLVLILPDLDTVARLSSWCELIGPTLEELSIIQKVGYLQSLDVCLTNGRAAPRSPTKSLKARRVTLSA